MEWVSTEVLRQVLEIGGVSGMLVFALYGMIKTFTNTFAKKDEKFADIIAANNNQFMQFIERERLENNTAMQKCLGALTSIQQEINKNSLLFQKNIKAIRKLSDKMEAMNNDIKTRMSELNAKLERLDKEEKK